MYTVLVVAVAWAACAALGVLAAAVPLTPGDAASLVQAWTPIVIAVAGTLGAALAAAVVAFQRTAALQDQVKALSRHVGKRSSDLNAVPRAAIPSPVAPSTLPPAAGGAGGLWYPGYSQLTDPNPDGSTPDAATTDCGWECCAMVIRVCRGIEVEADYLRFLAHGPAGQGWSSGPDLVACLRHHHFANAHSSALAAEPALVAVQDECASGRPVLALGNWLSADALHWVAVSAVGGGQVVYEDPWYGARRTVVSGEWTTRYAGVLVLAGERAVYSS